MIEYNKIYDTVENTILIVFFLRKKNRSFLWAKGTGKTKYSNKFTDFRLLLQNIQTQQKYFDSVHSRIRIQNGTV